MRNKWQMSLGTLTAYAAPAPPPFADTRSAAAEPQEMGLLSCDDTTYIQILWLTVHKKHGQTWGWNPQKPGRCYSRHARGHGLLIEQIEQAAGNVLCTLREWDSCGHLPLLLCHLFSQTSISLLCMTLSQFS
jgi:hypothetical protein